MTQHDYVIANQSFPSTRTDLNNVLQAIVSNNSGTSAPSTTFANQLFYNSSTNVLSIRNEDNDAFIPLMQFDQSADVAATLATVIDILDASGTNTAGTALTIRGGAGTGTGAGGSIILQTADGGSSGSSVNSHATAVIVLDDGTVGVGTATPTNATFDVAGRGRFLQDAAATTGAIILRESSGGVGGHIQFVSNDNSAQRGFIGSNSSGDILLGGAAERLRMLSAGGLTFGGDTAAANALDDYEEGTWTPRYLASSANPTVGYGNQIGRYVKVGQIVSASFRINTSSVSGGSGSLFIAGLPYAVETVSSMFSTLAIGFTSGWTISPQAGFLTSGGTSMQIFRNSGTNSYTTVESSVTVSDMGSSNDIVGHITYRSA